MQSNIQVHSSTFKNIQVHSRTFKKNIQARTLKEHSSSRTNMNPVPFCRISRCSQRMSPMNGGARLRNASRSSWIRSLPSTLKLLMLMPSRLNSHIAQLSHCITWIASQLCGSVRGHETYSNIPYDNQITIRYVIPLKSGDFLRGLKII